MKVRYIGASDHQVQWGSNDDPRGVLVEGDIYELADKEVHSWHTKYTLAGIKGRFNSVHFEEVYDPASGDPDAASAAADRARDQERDEG